MPESITFEPEGDIALAQIDAALTDGVRFGVVLAGAGMADRQAIALD